MALINYGEEYGKLVVISDVVDQNRVSTASICKILGTYQLQELENTCLSSWLLERGCKKADKESHCHGQKRELCSLKLLH